MSLVLMEWVLDHPVIVLLAEGPIGSSPIRTMLAALSVCPVDDDPSGFVLIVRNPGGKSQTAGEEL